MKKESLVLILGALLITVTAGTLARTHSLQKDRQILEKELERIQLITQSSVSRSVKPEPSMMDKTDPPSQVSEMLAAQSVIADENPMEIMDDYSTEIEALRLQLTQRDQEIAELKDKVENYRNTRDGRRWRREDRQEYMEKLKKEDPARYEEVQKQRADFRERLKVNAGDQFAFLTEVDVSEWPEELQENHERVLGTVAKINIAIRQAATEGDVSTTDLRQMFRELRDTREEFSAEREMLLYDTAKQIGFDESDSWKFVDYIQTVQSATSLRGLFLGRRGPQQQPSTQ